jgi:hypothetical protein
MLNVRPKNNMSSGFEMALSRRFAAADLEVAVTGVLPGGIHVNIADGMSGLPEEPSDFWAILLPTDDPAWPQVLSCMVARETCNLGKYPDLRLANQLFKVQRVNALCCAADFIDSIDQRDPYHALAHIDGSWYVASTAGTRLEGPYSDGRRKFAGEAPVKLVRRVELPIGVA